MNAEAQAEKVRENRLTGWLNARDCAFRSRSGVIHAVPTGGLRSWRCQRSELLRRRAGLGLQTTACSRHPQLLDAPNPSSPRSGRTCGRSGWHQIKDLNNIVEQDHRRIKQLVRPGLGFKKFRTAWRTLVGYETLAMMRKGQVKGIGGDDIVAQAAFLNSLFDVAA
jgi:hypothetical protein